VQRALIGGTQGVMQVAVTPHIPLPHLHDQDPHDH